MPFTDKNGLEYDYETDLNSRTSHAYNMIFNNFSWNLTQPAKGMVAVYALVDPFTYEYRYVGKTVNPLFSLESHIKESLDKDKCTSLKQSWINGVIYYGKRPLIYVLDWFDAETAFYKEREWYLTLKGCGANLTNGENTLIVLGKPGRDANSELKNNIINSFRNIPKDISGDPEGFDEDWF